MISRFELFVSVGNPFATRDFHGRRSPFDPPDGTSHAVEIFR